MTKTQLYIIIIIITVAILGWLGFNNQSPGTDNLPGAIGDPLELLLVKNTQDFNNDFYKNLKEIINIDIGPSPQPEQLLSIMEIDSEKFTGVFKRHQNLLFIEKSDVFSITFKMNVFALNQLVILVEGPSEKILKEKELIRIVKKIREVEIARLVNKFTSYENKDLKTQIQNIHDINLSFPKDFFLAYQDSNITWARRETAKISQGLLVANLGHDYPDNVIKIPRELKDEKDRSIRQGTNVGNLVIPSIIMARIDSIISPHISGPINGSYMSTEKDAPFLFESTAGAYFVEGKRDTSKYYGYLASKIEEIQSMESKFTYFQSLWNMENDFMGGIYKVYFFPQKEQIIYTYLYAPGQRKSISLLQIDACVHTID